MSSKNRFMTKFDETYEQLSTSPLIKGLLDGGMSLVPAIGPAIMSALDTRALKLFEQNTKRFAEGIRNQVNNIDESKLDKQFIESDEFVSLLIDIIARNASTHEKEKTRLFARIFVNSACHSYSKTPYKQGFVQIINDLTAAHIRILSLAYDRATVFPEEDGNKNRDYISLDDIQTATGIAGHRIEAYCHQMIRYGLLYDWSIGRATGPRANLFGITDYGKEFSAFLESNS